MADREYRVQYEITKENHSRLEKASNKRLVVGGSISFAVDNPVTGAIIRGVAGDDGALETRHMTEWVAAE